MPPRSSGCYSCRKRKIRCDEGRPGCERCIKHGIPCPGYRSEKDGIEFEDQTALTVKRSNNDSHRRKGDKSKAAGSTANPQLQLVWQTANAYQVISALTLPQKFSSPALEQAKIWDTFLDVYMPKSTGIQSLHFTYLRLLSQLAPKQPALRDGLNTLALVQIGAVHKDERLLHTAVESYGKALSNLGKAVAKPSSINDDLVLAAASILMVCEFYDKIKSESSGWFGHVFGIQQMLHLRGPDSLQSDLSLQLFNNARHASIARSYLMRTADPYDTPAWRAVAARAPMKDWSMELFNYMAQVPGRLQKLDQLDVDGPFALSEVDDLLAECTALEASLRSWYKRYHASLSAHGIKPWTMVSVEDFPNFASVVTDRTLPTAHKYSSFWSCYVHSQYWVAMHYLRTNIMIARGVREALVGVVAYPDLVTEEELAGYCHDICRGFPSFVEPEAGTQGHIGLFVPLAVILTHFRSRENWKYASSSPTHSNEISADTSQMVHMGPKCQEQHFQQRSSTAQRPRSRPATADRPLAVDSIYIVLSCCSIQQQ
jgi:hypothetical protein